MVLFSIILIVCLVLIVAGLIFTYGPYIIEAAVDKLDEWADIIAAFKEEK